MVWLIALLCMVVWLVCGYLARLLFLADLRLEAGPGAERFLGRDTRLMLRVYCLMGPPALFVALCVFGHGGTFAQRVKTTSDNLKRK